MPSLRRACATALAFVAVAAAVPASAAGEQLDQDLTGTTLESVRCTQGAEPGTSWSYGPAVALVPGRSGGLARVRTQLLLRAAPGTAVDPAATATLRVRENAGGGPGAGVLASRTFSASDVEAAPAGLSDPAQGTARVVELVVPVPVGVAAGRTLWVTLEPGSVTQPTEFCFAVTASSQEQDLNTVWFHQGRYAGTGTPGSEPRRVVVLSDYLGTVGTRLTAGPFVRANPSDPVRGFEALLTTTGSRVAAVPGQVVTFSVGAIVVCTATTGYDGYARCPDTALVPVQGYTVSFAGDDLLLPSLAVGRLYG